ncbi:carboxylesterase 1C-like [Saccostrea echinata]|uniref:carboxylesterase 1C-like n=1 Tax=Saccostrea echinata TaxID=191078 RepID=UPI002A81F463|nr:carboxylesterase 1C-like [Saccostrea echinata]
MKYKEHRMQLWDQDIPQLMESAPTGTVTIQTKLGPMTGKINYLDEDYRKKVLTFYNIPFAKPPVGELRFAKPVPYGSWTGTLNATEIGNQCMQYDPMSQIPGVESTEDCLYLNIYAPNNVSGSVKKPVMVWIHGGGFVIGSAYAYDSSTLALQGDVIVVTIQYRLGIFGFFSLGKNGALGNYGLWDQMLALEWVQQNIESFGGDPSSVTIFGESAGGASVSLLALIPQNKNRFHRVIAQSGTMAAPWAITNATEASYAIGELMGCSKALLTSEFVKCMRNSDANTLLYRSLGYSNRNPNFINYVPEIGPVVDGELIKASPTYLMKTFSSEEYKFFSSLDFMTGTVKSDGNVYLLVMTEAFQRHYGINVTTGISTDQFCSIFVSPISEDLFKNNSLVSKEICNKYQVKNNVSEQSRQMVNFFTDVFFAYPAFESLSSHSQNNIQSSTFHYVFELDVQSFLFSSPPVWYIGPGHADELGLIFPFYPLSGQGKSVSAAVMRYWTNFAKRGNPNDPSLPDWTVYDNQKQAYLAINANQFTAMKYKERDMQFWEQDIPRLMDTTPTGTITIPTKLGSMTVGMEL